MREKDGDVHGLFSGVFLGRAARLWRLAAEHGAGFPFVLKREPQ